MRQLELSSSVSIKTRAIGNKSVRRVDALYFFKVLRTGVCVAPVQTQNTAKTMGGRPLVNAGVRHFSDFSETRHLIVA